MKLGKCQTDSGEQFVVEVDAEVVRPLNLDGSGFSSADNPAESAAALVSEDTFALADVQLLAPVDQQEI